MRVVIAAAIIQDKKILLVRKRDRDTWIFPGGQPEEERDRECLCREVSEELSGTIPKDIYNQPFMPLVSRKRHNLLVDYLWLLL